MTEYVIEFVLDDKTSVTKIMEFENADDANAAILSEMSNPTPEFIQVEMPDGICTFRKSRVVFVRHMSVEEFGAVEEKKTQVALRQAVLARLP